MKGGLWEGAVRCPALVWSPLLRSAPRVSGGLMHVVDWLPTLYTAAGPQSSQQYSGASGTEDAARTPAFSPQQVLSSAAGRAVTSALGAATPAEDVLSLRAQATVSCPDRPLEPRCLVLDSSDLCVFDLEEDPCEAGDGLAPEGVLSSLLERLESLSQPLQPQVYPEAQPRLADPRRWNNTWVPWTDCVLDEADEACNVVAPS